MTTEEYKHTVVMSTIVLLENKTKKLVTLTLRPHEMTFITHTTLSGAQVFLLQKSVRQFGL